MRKSRLAKIESELMRLQEGDLMRPIKVEGIGVYHAILRRLETLRLTLLKLKDEEVDSARRTNTAIASVAHDMKTPLAVISGYAECISDGMDDKDYPALILQKTNQMNEMVISLVEDIHNSIEKQTGNKVLHGARAYFTEAVNRMRPSAEAKNITIKMSKVPNAQVRLDAQQFGRVLQNLISNAVKYSPEGSTIKISFKLWAKTLRIKIKDRGVGIAKESLPFVFDRFYTENKARTDGSSNGLGLYITKQIVQEHGGKVSVYSKKGKGSTFTVVIPVEPDLQEKRTITESFNGLPLWQKILFELVFGWLMASVYRVTRFFESRNLSTLMFGLLCIPLFPFVWLIDFLGICVYGKITFLAD